MVRKRVPVRTQVSQTECGLACSLAILEYHGRYQNLKQARAIVTPGRNGLSVEEVRHLLATNGCTVGVFRASPSRLGELDMPAIVFWKNYHFVVLERLTDKYADLMDPDTGRRRVSRAEFDESFSRIVITAIPSPNFRSERRPFMDEWRLPGLRWDIRWGSLVSIIATTLGTYVLSLAVPMLTARMVDSATKGQSSLGMTVIAVALSAGIVCYIAAEALRAFASSRLVRALGSSMARSAFGHLLRLPLSFFSTRIPGELMQRLGALTFVRDALSNRIVQGLFDIGMTVAILGYVFHVSTMLGLLASGLMAALLLFLLASRTAMSRAIEEEIHALTVAQGAQYDAVSSIAQLKMGGYVKDMENRWSEDYDRSLGALHRRMMWQLGAVGSVTGAFQIFGPILMMLCGLQLNGSVTLGQVVAVTSVGSLIFGGVSGLLTAYTDLVTCSRYLRRVEDIMGTDVEPTGGSLTALPHGGISLRDVGFRYANEAAPVLQGLDIEIGDGELVALVGQSGSGKSTLAKLLCGLYHPTQGQIWIGGHPLQDYDLDELRRQIGYVPQDVSLHNGSLLENLAMGAGLTDDEVIARCRALDFLDFVDELPMGYRTLVSDLGANFSGGQRQRLAIARVLLRSPRIVVFDEATSSLDRMNERRVNRVLERLGCTRIVIAHRLETVQNADSIHVVDRGSLVERGTHDHLLKMQGTYASLYRNGVPA